MKHYLAVLMPTAGGGWHAHLPDFPGCDAEGPSVEVVMAASSGAASEMARWLQQQGVSLPTSQTYEDLRYRMNGWASERGIDWSRAVITMVPLASREGGRMS
jgi:predicted RNase H-like HicB family nuclease